MPGRAGIFSAVDGGHAACAQDGPLRRMRSSGFFTGCSVFCYSPDMSELRCYRCGASLEALSLPLSRLDECPSCSVYLHCCRMCRFFDPAVAEQCTEDDAEEVKEKARANFCDYFKPGYDVYDPTAATAEARAKNSLDDLFGGASGDDDQDGTDSSNAAEDLFR